MAGPAWQRITFALPLAIDCCWCCLRYDCGAGGGPEVAVVLAASRAGSGARESAAGVATLCGIAAGAGTARVCAERFADAAGVCDARWSEPGLAPAVREFTEIYAHARFGGAPCDALRLRGLLEQIRAARRGSAELQSGVCSYRRSVNPKRRLHDGSNLCCGWRVTLENCGKPQIHSL